MQTLVVKQGTAWLNRFEGVVLHADRDLETRIASSGGGGYVGPEGGYVAAPQITSTKVEHQTFFARDANGVESRFQWSDWTLPVRPGSRVAVVWGARTGATEGPYFGAINLDTNEERWAFNGWIEAQGLVTAPVRGWLCFFVSLLIAAALVYGIAFKDLSGRPRAERQALDDARLALGVAVNDLQISRTGTNMIGASAKPTAPASPQRIEAARENERKAMQALRLASDPPPRPTTRQVFALLSGDLLYQVGFIAALACAFCGLLVLDVIRAARASLQSVKSQRIEDRLRTYLRTGELPL